MTLRHWNDINNDWLRTLQFYKNELMILSGRLKEIAAKNLGQDVAVSLWHFQEQFKLHTKNIEEQTSKIIANRKQMEKEPSQIVNNPISDLKQLELQFLEEEKAIFALRHSFNLFCEDWIE